MLLNNTKSKEEIGSHPSFSDKKPRLILCIHLYRPSHVIKVFKKLAPLIEAASEIWLSSANANLLSNAERLLNMTQKPVVPLLVENRWYDWSGYLEFLRRMNPTDLTVLCNDSIVNRRLLTKLTLKRFIKATTVAPEITLIGELDTSMYSVRLGERSSACWISSYLLTVRGFRLDVPNMEKRVSEYIEGIIRDRKHLFNSYLSERRPNLYSNRDMRISKVGAMCFERELSLLAGEAGATIVNFCAGSKVRKLERFFERLLDS